MSALMHRGLVIAVAVIVAGCGSSGGSGAGDGKRVDGGRLVVAFASDAAVDSASLDPNVNATGRNIHSVLGAMFDSLVYQDPRTGKVVPGLAERWKVSRDGKRYTFTLKRNARFWNGTPVTAEDVKFSIERAISERYGAQVAYARSLLSQYDHSEVIDQHTITVAFKTTQPSVLELALSRDYFSIVSKAYLEKVGDKAFASKPMGSGPFKLSEWKRGDHITIERNPDYAWGPPFLRTAKRAPSVAKIEFRFVPEASTRIAALQSGQVNVMQTIPPRDQARLEENDAISIVPARKNGQNAGLNIQTRRAPTSELAVRRAIAYAVDREALNKSVYAGRNFPATHMLEDRMGDWVNRAAALPGHDLAKAKQILDQAGWTPGSDGIRVKDGKRLELLGVGSAGEQQAMTLIQAQLKAAGMDLQIQSVSLAQIAEIVSGSGKFNLAWQAAYGFPGSDPAMLYSLYHSRLAPPNGPTNFGQVKIPEVDRLLETAMATLDREKRRAMYHRVQQILADYVAYLPLVSFNVNLATVNGVHGIVPDIRGQYLYFNDVWLDKSLHGRWKS